MIEMCLDKRILDSESRSYVELLLGKEEEMRMGRDWWRCKQERMG